MGEGGPSNLLNLKGPKKRRASYEPEGREFESLRARQLQRVTFTHELHGEGKPCYGRCAGFGEGPFVFATERGGPLTRSRINKLVERAGELTGLLITAMNRKNKLESAR